MTEQKTREKICEIIAPYVSAWGDDTTIANALIGAGIGDVSEYKHRAARAERALKIAVTNAYDYTYEEAIEQAKKELEEEGKDD